MADFGTPNVAHHDLPEWVQEVVTREQTKLSRRMRWQKVVTHEDIPFTPTRTLVALTVGTFMNAEGDARPSLTTLAKASKLGRSTVWTEIQWLRDHDWITVKQGGPGKKGASRYSGRYPEEDPRVVQEPNHLVQDVNHMVQEPNHSGSGAEPEGSLEGSSEEEKKSPADQPLPLRAENQKQFTPCGECIREWSNRKPERLVTECSTCRWHPLDVRGWAAA